MEPIVGGWHLVFYFGNFLADTGVAIFAISVWEFDKKIENYKKNLSESSVTDAAELNSLTNQYRILVRIKFLKCASIYLLVIGIIIQLVALLFSNMLNRLWRTCSA